jgi:hypothetical protein
MTSVPIGRPIANTQVYILDAHMQPVPVGECGDLYIGGDGLGRDYLNRPQLTAERFVPDPFSHRPGARLYRTGDLVRYLPDGKIEFIGRIDQQVKIRGFRIELGEIEAVLGRYAPVRQCLVIAPESATGHRRLTAYYVPARDPAPDAGELRDYLRQHLPDYMVPSQFVMLHAWPLTPSGKVDRRALPDPGMIEPSADKPSMPPRTMMEQMVLKIWREVIGQEHLSVSDNFFDLGGTSLNLMQVHRRICHALNADVPITTLFQYPTISSLAQYLTCELRDQSPLRSLHDRAKQSREALARQKRLVRGRTSE